MTQQRVPWYYILILILAGESIFVLPFVVPRVFRATLLSAYELDDLQLGTCFSIYGLVALASYIFGGAVADKVSARVLMGTALIATGLGGIYMSTFPSYEWMKVLYGYWGFTTIFLFWAPMIKATRNWGGQKKQGLAFGLLDGGRGLVGALFGVLGVAIFSSAVNTSDLSLLDKREAFSQVVLFSSILVMAVGLLVILVFKTQKSKEETQRSPLKNYMEALKIPSVWLLMIIICCAYVGYKVTDLFSLYAAKVLKYEDVGAASIGTFLLFIRPVVGITIGLVADRKNIARFIILAFILTIIGSALFASGVIEQQAFLLFMISMVITAIGVYAARALYFAVFNHCKIPWVLTGTVVGLVSVIGYTPDIFASPLMGYLLKEYPGKLGHQYVFLVVIGFSLIGLICSIFFYRINRKFDNQQ